MSKRFSKYNVSFDYFNKSLIVLSVTTDSISIALFETVIGALVAFSFSARIVKKTVKNDKK